MTINQALVSGFLGRDPEPKNNSQSGQDMCFFSVATNFSTKNESGEWETQTEWHRIVCFGRLASLAIQHLKKGSRVTVLGRLRTRKWTGKDGIDRYATEIVAEKVEFMALGQAEEAASSRATTYQQPVASSTYDDDAVPF